MSFRQGPLGGDFAFNYARSTIYLDCCPRGLLHGVALCSESVGIGKRSAGVSAEAKTTGVIVMMIFAFIFASLRIVRPLLVLCVGLIFTCTDAHDA